MMWKGERAMEAISAAVLRLAAFSAAAGLGESLLPEGKARRLAQSVWSLLALRLLASLFREAVSAFLN